MSCKQRTCCFRQGESSRSQRSPPGDVTAPREGEVKVEIARKMLEATKMPRTDDEFVRFWERTENLVRWTENSRNSETDKLQFEEEVATKREQAEAEWRHHRNGVKGGA